MKSINDFIINKKNVLLRVDLNVPVINGKITEKTRIYAVKKTIKKLKEQNNKIFLISHFGRPKGEINKIFSLKFILTTLEEEFELTKIYFLETLNEKLMKETIEKMQPGDVCLIENIRFNKGEESNDLNFSKQLSKNFDIFVNDAFSASHREHASIVGIPKFLPSFAGYSLIDEIKNINFFLKDLKKPNLAIIGGSKISTKINLLYNLIESFDVIIIGGAMANTFLHAEGINIGNSLCEKNLSLTALSIINKAKKFKCKIILPLDVICADSLEDKINVKECRVVNVLSNQMVLDLGSKTTKLISKYIKISKMILWNGPLGAFEYEDFAKSSLCVATFIKNNAKKSNFLAIAGGGDTISVIKNAKAEGGFSYISKAGGAFLEWLEGKKSPGILSLEKNIIN